MSRKVDFGAVPQPPLGGKTAKGLGKNSRQQNLGSPHSGIMSTVAGGDPMSRMMGQHGKKHSFTAPPMRSSTMAPHPSAGGLDQAATAAPPGNYATSGPDTTEGF
jgi:hypothetical protein